MKSAAITARTATSATSCLMTRPSAQSAKAFALTRSTLPMPKRSGRKAKKWPEKLSMPDTQSLTSAEQLAATNTAHFPNESAEYRAARNALLIEEIELRRHIERV